MLPVIVVTEIEHRPTEFQDRAMTHKLQNMNHDGLLTLANLVHVMLADNRIASRELRLLESAADRIGIRPLPPLSELLETGMSKGLAFSSDRAGQLCLAECLRVAAADGEIDPAESRAWKQLAISLGYSAADAEGALEAGVEALETTPDPFEAIRLALTP